MQRERYQATRAVGSGATLLLCLLLAWLPQAASADLLLPVPDRRDHVFDPLGRWLYVTTESGAVERFELPGGRRLPAFGLGGPLNALDVTPDGTALYVAEHYRTGGQGAFARIDVATGRVTRISFDPGSHEYGAWDVAITSTGLGMTTTRGSGKLRELDTATGSLSIVPLSTFGYEPIRGEASIGRGADRTLLVFSDARPVFTYDAEADRFSPQIHSVARWNSASGVDRNATLIGVEVETGVKLFTASRLAVGEIPGILGGFVFDSVADVLYGVEPQHDELVLFDTDGLGEIGRMPIGENVGTSQTFGDGVMSISDTGQWIALSTPSGIRVFELPDRAPPGDPDGDGWSGTDDSCPLDPNPLQDDPDGDGWGSPCDNCPALSNPDQPDLDRDGRGDACDPFPGLALAIVPSPAWSVALAGDSVRVRYRLETRDGSPLPDLPGVRATLTVNGSARFGSTATQGILLEGGGTARVKVEFVAGAFEIDVSDPTGETVRLGAEDTDRIGIEMLAPIETFEVDDGGFSAPGLLWEHGVPASGPERAFSGTRVWATGLAAAPAEGVSESLVSPAIGLPVDSTPWLEYVSWLSTRFSDAVVEVSSDAGASWTALETRSGFHPEYTRRSFDLSAWSGQTVRIRFRYESEDHSLYSGWYLDDVAIRGVGTMLDFLDPAGDLDDDGLTNQEELSLGTDPYDPDFDGDGIDDGSDNCPLAANAEQSDAVHPGGAGDACDDPEGDGISDDRDNCPDAANPEQENTDGDRLGDTCDPFPTHDLVVRPVAPASALTGEAPLVTYRLELRDGTLEPGLAGVRATLTLDGSAVFGAAAVDGILLEGGGTSRARVEFVGGRVTLPVRDAVAEQVLLDGEDTANVGLDVAGATLDDFEGYDGSFSTAGALWEHGIPTSGPEAAFSGARVWATRLAGDYSDGADERLVSRLVALTGERPSLEFVSWFNASSRDVGYVEVSDDDGTSWTTLSSFEGSLVRYAHQLVDLSAWSGQTVRVRFRFTSDGYASRAGWYLDDVGFRGVDAKLDFLDPASDLDDDGLSSQEELALGTDPRDPDFDGDGVDDGTDSCPLTENAGQSDAVHPGGAGDACDDPDGDGVFDARDNCPDAANPEQTNTDGDRLGDVCDPFPTRDLVVRPVAPAVALAGAAPLVTYRLERRDGAFEAGLVGVQTTLTLGGSAVFGSSAASGILLAGGGTSRARVEFVDGMVALPVSDGVAEVVHLDGEDTEEVGLAYLGGVADFENDRGGFSTSGQLWEHGIPTAGPEAAFSGARLWATRLAGDYGARADESLVSRPVALPGGAAPVLEYASWFDSADSLDNAHVELSNDGSVSWTRLETQWSRSARYSVRSLDLSAWSGQLVQVRFRFRSSGSGSAAGWYVDDVVLRGVGAEIDFLEAGADLDDDGLTNAEELALGTEPRAPDFDGDGLDDGSDNCPLVENADQRDAVHPGGAGDACDDPEHDGVVDARDNCPDAPNASQSNLDGDPFGDACDAFPSLAFTIVPVPAQRAVAAGGTTRVTYRLETRAGVPLPDLTGVRTTLTVDGSAAFGTSAVDGAILGGGGTSRVRVEFVNGRVTLDVHGAVAELVRLGVDDTQAAGIELAGSVFEDFEFDDGGFSTTGSLWERGVPSSGPGAAFSGSKVWATDLDDAFPEGVSEGLVSQPIALRAEGIPTLEYTDYVDFGGGGRAQGEIQISDDDGASWTVLRRRSGNNAVRQYYPWSFDLSAWSGRTVLIRFLFSSSDSGTAPGWYIDDVVLRDIAGAIHFVPEPASRQLLLVALAAVLWLRRLRRTGTG